MWPRKIQISQYIILEEALQLKKCFTAALQHREGWCDYNVTVIQLDQNQFKKFCPNGRWLSWTFWNFLGQIKYKGWLPEFTSTDRCIYCGFSSGGWRWVGWGQASSPFPWKDSVWSLLDFNTKKVNFCCLLGGIAQDELLWSLFIRRPSVHQLTFSNNFSSEAAEPILLKFHTIW